MVNSPDSSHAPDPLMPLVEEFLERIERGERVTIDEYCDRHPELSADIREVFPALAVLQDLQPDRPNDMDDSDPNLPERIGDYRIIAEIGRGGMGIVYEAEQESLGRRVALKVLPGRLQAVSGTKVRFQQEARAAAKMHHTNIVPVFEVGEDGDHVFYAMQLIPGQSLDRVIEELNFAGGLSQSDDLGGALSSAAAPTSTSHGSTSSLFRDRLSDSSSSRRYRFYRSVATIGVQVADALAFAHARGVIHRDIKPSNLLLDADGVVWVTDFGLAKIDDEGMTQTGDFLGTLRYMSPERFDGTCDSRADIYGFGLTLYELVVQRPAFESSDRLQLIQQINQADRRRPRSIDPRIPRDLETIILKSIERDASQRYASADALREDLQRFVEDRPILARRVSVPERIVRWSRHHPASATLVATLLLVTLAGIAGITWKWRDAEQQRILADQRTVESHWQGYRANIAAASAALHSYHIEAMRRFLEATDVGIRGWEWQHLHSRLDRSIANLPGPHTGDIHCVRFGPAGTTQLMASRIDPSGTGGHTTVWEYATGRKTELLPYLLAAGADRFQHYGNTAAVGQCVSVLSRDGQFLATWEGGTLRLAPHAQRLYGRIGETLSTDVAEFTMPVFSPDSTLLASWCDDLRVRIWHTSTGELASELEMQTEQRTWLMFSPDGSRILSWVRDPTNAMFLTHFQLWDPATGRLVSTIHDDESVDVSGGSFAFSPDGALFAAGEEYPRNSIRVWATETGDRVAELNGHDNSVTCLTFSPDGSYLASGSRDRTVILWDLRTHRPVAHSQGHVADVRFLLFHPDGELLVLASSEGAIRLWDIRSEKIVSVLVGENETIADGAFSADGRYLCTSYGNGSVRVWDVESERRTAFLGHTSFVYDVTFSPDGTEVASAAWDNTLLIHDVSTGERVLRLASNDEPLLGVAYSPDGTLIAASSSNHIYVWRLSDARRESPAPILTIPNQGDNWYGRQSIGVAFDQDSSRLFFGAKDGSLRAWHVATGEIEQVFSGHDVAVNDVCISPDGGLLLAAAGTVQVFNAANYDPIACLGDNSYEAWAVSCNHDSRLVATVGADATPVRLWDASTWDLVAELSHATTIFATAFSPDGKRLAVACNDHTIRLWDLQRFEEVAILRNHSGYVHAVEFSPDGSKLVSCSGDHTVRIWDTQPARLRAPSEVRE